jgi:transposase, IS5 family
MRKRFESQLAIGQLLIENTPIKAKNKHALDELLRALKEIYCNPAYNEKIFLLLEKHINTKKKKTGRTGMTLWCMFVLAQVRLCKNYSYADIHNFANNHGMMRQLMGIEYGFGYDRIEFEYQNIYDNVSLISDELLVEINKIILDFGHKEVFKKKENTALRLKTDSFAIESNVHFPTDYNLLWDCARKCLSMVSKFVKKYNGIEEWRKYKNWGAELKGFMRELGKTSGSGGKNKDKRLKKATSKYLKKAKSFSVKLKSSVSKLPINDNSDEVKLAVLNHFIGLMDKHIDLVDRRLLQGEEIPHAEKMFSVFETYTEWIKKGKKRPSVELGKKLSITTDQYNLIVDYEMMTKQQDRDVVPDLGQRLLEKYKVASWSFDKGYWLKSNKEFLQSKGVAKVIMPKLGKRNKEEDQEEKSRSFKLLKNKHSAVESNINELEQRGLDRCPDRGLRNFKKYISLAVCAYNLKKIGRELLRQERVKLKKRRAAA